MLAWGLGGPQDIEAARKMLKRAWDCGETVAPVQESLDREGYAGEKEYRDGMNAFYGWLETKDHRKAEKLLLEAVDLGHHEARVQLARWHYDRVVETDADTERKKGHPQQAIYWARKAAETGHPRGQAYYGDRYLKGDGVPKYLPEALDWYRLAAEQGHSGAQNFLGSEQQRGVHLDLDLEAAANWFRRAADTGNKNAMQNLADMYSMREGNESNLHAAIYWGRQAVEYGMGEGRDLSLGVRMARKVNKKFKGQENPEFDAETLRYLRNAAERRALDARNLYGLVYFFGLGVEVDVEKATQWAPVIKRRKDPGRRESLMGYLHYELENYGQASQWFRKAIDSGSKQDEFYFRTSLERAEDRTALIALLEQISKRDLDARAIQQLAAIYARGDGVPPNPDKAQKLAETVRLLGRASDGFLRIIREPNPPGEELYRQGQNARVGRGQPSSVNKAERLYRQAADAGHVLAAAELGTLLVKGNEITRDVTEGMLFLQQAAEGGDAASAFSLGAEYERGENVKENLVEAER